MMLTVRQMTVPQINFLIECLQKSTLRKMKYIHHG
jgi:hypothetical protein